MEQNTPIGTFLQGEAGVDQLLKDGILLSIMSTASAFIKFTDVSYTWPDPESPGKPVFDAFTAEIPGGFISLTGPNGAGKSTLMLFAGGRVMHSTGQVELCGHDTRILSGIWKDDTGARGPGLTPEIEHARNLVCSFLYQNMEFDADGDDNSRVGALLEFVYVNGGHRSKDERFLKDVSAVFELETLLSRKLDALSKGEIQRVLLAFSALYGSKAILMDEPVFAMEQRQKEKALEFFRDMRLRSGVSVLVSLHELALTRKYADTAMLFYPDRRIDLGTCDEVLTKEALEDAYGVPAAMLHDTEKLTRTAMLEREKALGAGV